MGRRHQGGRTGSTGQSARHQGSRKRPFGWPGRHQGRKGLFFGQPARARPQWGHPAICNETRMPVAIETCSAPPIAPRKGPFGQSGQPEEAGKNFSSWRHQGGRKGLVRQPGRDQGGRIDSLEAPGRHEGGRKGRLRGTRERNKWTAPARYQGGRRGPFAQLNPVLREGS